MPVCPHYSRTACGVGVKFKIKRLRCDAKFYRHRRRTYACITVHVNIAGEIFWGRIKLAETMRTERYAQKQRKQIAYNAHDENYSPNSEDIDSWHIGQVS